MEVFRVMTYDLELSNMNCNVPKGTKIRLLKEVLGYTKEEATQLVNESWKLVAVNLNVEQVRLIATPFREHDINLYAKKHNTDEDVYYNDFCPLDKGEPKTHYYDEPVVGREHLVDPNKPDPKYPFDNGSMPVSKNTKPVVECPYCHSTNVKKISGAERVASVAMLGIFSKKINKSFKCNNCGGTF